MLRITLTPAYNLRLTPDGGLGMVGGIIIAITQALSLRSTPAYNKRITRDAGYNSELTYNYLLHWDVVGFGGDIEVELFAETNTYSEEVAVF